MSNTLKPMRSIWLSLFWKEWREQRWKLAAVTVLIFVFPSLPLLLDNVEPRFYLELLGISVIPYSILAGLFFGMGVAADERQRGTMRFLQTLPISTRKPAIVKLASAWLVICFPITLIAVAGYFASPPKAVLDRIEVLEAKSIEGLTLAEQEEWFQIEDKYGSWDLHAPFRGNRSSLGVAQWAMETITYGIIFATSLLLWMAACGVDRSDEVRAGAIGFLVILLIWGALIGLFNLAEDYQIDWLENSLAIPISAAPGAIAFLWPMAPGLKVPFAVVVVTSLLTHAGLVAWYVKRYGGWMNLPEKSGVAGWLTKPQTIWLGNPRRSPTTAMIWKQAWETGPLALFSVLAVLAIALTGYWTQDRESPLSSEFSEILSGVTAAVGFLVSIVAGIGVFMEDMRPQVGEFWRSRPVRFQHWFWIKYVIGLLVLVASYGMLLLLAYMFMDHSTAARVMAPEFLNKILIVGLVFLLLYTLSIATFGWTRHPVLAAMLTIVIFLLGLIALQVVYEHHLPRDAKKTFGIAVAATALVTAIAAAISSVRRMQSLR